MAGCVLARQKKQGNPMKSFLPIIFVAIVLLGLSIFVYTSLMRLYRQDKPAKAVSAANATVLGDQTTATLSVVSVDPPDTGFNAGLNQKIQVILSREIATAEAELSVSPSYSHSVVSAGNYLVVTPNESLLPGTLYTYVVKFPATNTASKTYTFQTVGPTQKYRPDTKPTAALESVNNFQRQSHPDVFLANQTPYSGETFSVSSNFRDNGAKGHFYFVVYVKSAQSEKGKADFMQWLSSLKLSSDQIGTLDIEYRQ